MVNSVLVRPLQKKKKHQFYLEIIQNILNNHVLYAIIFINLTVFILNKFTKLSNKIDNIAVVKYVPTLIYNFYRI